MSALFGYNKIMTKKVSIIGLDGATFRLILPLVKKGKLPTLEGMMKKGSWGELESTIHPLSPQAWASFMTGKNPGKHGIFEFIEHKPYSYDLHYVNGGFVQGKKLWELLSNAGKRVCVINVPFTYPPDKVNGCLIAGLDSPGSHSDFCYPPHLLSELIKKFGEYQLRQHPYKATPESFLEKISEQFDYILKIAKYLKAKESWDLFMVVFESTDLVQHFYWHYAFPEEFGIPPTDKRALKEAIFNVYKKIDKGLGELLSLCKEEETVIVMSDHGFSPCRKIIFMDNWLHQHGYLAYRKEERKHYTLTRALHLSFQKYFPNRFKGLITSLLPGLKDKVRSYLTFASIDWKRTKAFSLGIDSTNIFINVKGRFPEGIVQEGKAYEDLRDEIKDKFEKFIDPETKEKIVEKVYKREELFHGDSLKKAPDLLVTWKNFEYNTRRGYGKEGDGLIGSSLEFSDVSSYSSLQKSGTHHLKGVFIVRGPMIKNMKSFDGARIIDLAPTVLYLLGEKVPDDMDGRVLAKIIKDDFLSTHPVQFSSSDLEKEAKGSGYNEQEESYIRDKLKGLGYID
jgi:predicted AlkP superfamily phosphohydrolase/phosphomutase